MPMQGGGDRAYPITFDITLAGTSTSTGIFRTFLNPFGAECLVLRADLDITTQSTGASTLDIGTAADAVTTSDNLIDGLSAATAGRFTNMNSTNAGTNGKQLQKLAAGGSIVIEEKTGDVDGLVGTLYVTLLVTN
ncbi:MAG: hypothetical protein EB117_14610 [Betaproteobacteria bacterium]|nr:hypothetical protein [Betaproteobacteria bacterium]